MVEDSVFYRFSAALKTRGTIRAAQTAAENFLKPSSIVDMGGDDQNYHVTFAAGKTDLETMLRLANNLMAVAQFIDPDSIEINKVI